MVKSLNEIKRDICLLTLDIKCLDLSSKKAAIAQLEETIDLLKIETEHLENNGTVPFQEEEHHKHKSSIDQRNNKEMEVLQQIPQQEHVNEETISLDPDTFHSQTTSINVKQTAQKLVDKSLEKESNATEIEYICNICQKQYKNRKTLLQHKNIHTGKHKCHKCKAPFMSMSKLNNHYRDPNNCLTIQEIRSWRNVIATKFSENDARKEKEPQPEVGKKIFQCPECPNHYKTMYYLRKHKLTHIGKYKCHMCEATFVERSKLNIHTKDPKNCRNLPKVLLKLSRKLSQKMQ